jgi:DnaJ-class molecular chaperone
MSNFFTLEDCFLVLGLDPKKSYSANDLKKTFKKLALKYHPDRNVGDPLAEEIFKKVKEAYDIITNPSFRFKKYSKSTELNIILNFNLSFEEGFFGKKFELNFNTDIHFKNQRGEVNIDYFNFEIPAGSSGLFEKIYPNKGFKKNDEVGDILLRANIKPHAIFHLQGNNVLSNVPVPLSLLIKGGFVSVATLYGIHDIKIKPGTPPESSISIPNCGVNEQNYHIAILKLIFPTKEELKTTDWNTFGINWDLDI